MTVVPKKDLLLILDIFNYQYPVGSEVIIESDNKELSVTKVAGAAELFGDTYPVVRLSHKDGYTWLGRIVKFADKHPKIKITR